MSCAVFDTNIVIDALNGIARVGCNATRHTPLIEFDEGG